MVRLDRAARKVLALASALGVIGAAVVTSAAPAGAATSSGPRQQAIVALAGDSAVSVPGLHVQSVLGAVHVEIVDGTAAQLAALATTPGVVGVEPNAVAHLDADLNPLPTTPDAPTVTPPPPVSTSTTATPPR